MAGARDAMTDTQKGWVMEAVEAARKTCDEQNLKVESEVQDFLKEQGLTIYEPDSVSVFNAIVPEYLGGIIYGALRESLCSEQAARRTAMDSATKNAEEMIDGLSLQYNRARQGAITQELTEIVAGAEN